MEQKKSYRRCKSGKRMTIVTSLICVVGFMFVWSSYSLAASAKDSKKQEVAPAPPSAIQKPGKTAPSPTIAPSSSPTQQGTIQTAPSIKIEYFKRKAASESAMATHPLTGGTAQAPDSTTIERGESFTLTWGIKACNVELKFFQFSGAVMTVKHLDQSITPDGCTFYQAERKVEPIDTTTYTITTSSGPAGSGHIASKKFTAIVKRARLEIPRPEVNDTIPEVTIFAVNHGELDITHKVIQVECRILDKDTNTTLSSAMFRTSPMDIPKGGRHVQLGRVSFDRDRMNLRARDSVDIAIDLRTLGDEPIYGAERKFSHTWERKTYVIDNEKLNLLNSSSNYNIRLNNYKGGDHPYVANDCYIKLNIAGKEIPSENKHFSIDPYVEENIPVWGPFQPVPVPMDVAIYVHNILASKRAPANFFSIRDGKLVVRLELPNSGSREIKIGHLTPIKKEFQDEPLADVDLGLVTIEVLLTPVFRDGKITYEQVEVRVPDLNTSLVGALSGFLNESDFLRRFLRRTLRNVIIDELTPRINNNDMRNAVADGIAANLPREITRILGISASGNKITVSYE